jgi:hypothetical protein
VSDINYLRRYSKDKTAITVNDSLTLAGISAEASLTSLFAMLARR